MQSIISGNARKHAMLRVFLGRHVNLFRSSFITTAFETRLTYMGPRGSTFLVLAAAVTTRAAGHA